MKRFSEYFIIAFRWYAQNSVPWKIHFQEINGIESRN